MNKDLGNPLLAAMPKMLAPQELTREIQSLPPLPAAPSLEGLALLSSIFIPMDRKTLFGNVVKKCIQCSRTSEKRNNIVKKFKYSASYFELYTKFTPNEKDFRCGFQISYEP